MKRHLTISSVEASRSFLSCWRHSALTTVVLGLCCWALPRAALAAAAKDAPAETLAGAAATGEAPARAANPEAEKAWKDVMKAARPPAQPEEWTTRKPTAEERDQYRKKLGEFAGQAADKAKDFYTRFPKAVQADEAKKMEAEMLQAALRFGNEGVAQRVEALAATRLQDPAVPEEERAQIRAQQVQRTAMKKQVQGEAAVLAEYEAGTRAMLKEYPKQAIPYQMLLSVAEDAPADRAKIIAAEIRDSAQAPEEIRQMAAKLLKKMEAVGKPLAIKFTAVDGRAVDLEKLKGKVVLVDFWATWCGPCVAELPNVKAAFLDLHPKGFEIVGISFDQEKEALTKFVQEKQMDWPQYFDGAGWQNKFGQEFGINGIPAMWLVDKKGILRDQNARGDLAKKVEKLLAEP